MSLLRFGVEGVEVVLAADDAGQSVIGCNMRAHGGRNHSHARAGTGGEVELLATAGPGRHARQSLPDSRELGPRQVLDGRVPRRVRRLDGHRTVALDETYDMKGTSQSRSF